MPKYLTYQALESAVARMYGADDDTRRGALKARLDNLKRIGGVGANPGKGQRVIYDRETCARVLLALELGEFGAPPAVVAAAFHGPQGETITKLLADAASGIGEDIVLTVRPAVVSAAFRGLDVSLEIGLVPGIKAMEGLYEWLRSPLPRDVTGTNPRVGIFNLSYRLRCLDKALTDTAKPAPAEPTGLASQVIDAGKVARGEMSLRQFRAKHKKRRKSRVR